ncbi:hypothetical protein BJ170DRAFT_358603 [Xylariales sp. AK1849]|nr:hypothetical protein BJ170DRAFT_358603 [Xylariales sp. AK1849]
MASLDPNELEDGIVARGGADRSRSPTCEWLAVVDVVVVLVCLAILNVVRRRYLKAHVLFLGGILYQITDFLGWGVWRTRGRQRESSWALWSYL